MDFDNMEQSIYGGNVEEDEELLAELMALQNEDKIVDRRSGGMIPAASSSSGPNRRPLAQPPSAAPPTKRPVAGASRELNQADLSRALQTDVSVEDDGVLSGDEDLENELADLVGPSAEEAPPPRPPPRAAPPPPSAVAAVASSAAGNEKVEYLRQLGDFYAKLLAETKAAGNTLKANRYNRSVDKCRELQKRAQRGLPIDDADIPVAPPNFQVSSAAGVSSGPPSAPPPPLPQKQQSPPPVPTRQASMPQEIPVQAAPPDPVQPTVDPVSGDKRERIRSILKRRRDAYVINGKAAVAAKDKAAAMEYVTAAKQFDEALSAVDSADVGDLDEAEIPPSPRAYKKPPPPPSTFEGGLQARKERFEQMAESHKEKGDERRYRMNMRQVGQYAEAIKAARAGRQVNVAELPTLPDFPPLLPQTAPAAPAKVGPSRSQPPKVQPPAVGPFAPSGTTQTRNANQLEFLLERQMQFKQAALAAKNAGNMELAKKYMVEAKGFDQMINASRGGLPVNIASTPIPPQALTSQSALQPRIGEPVDGRRSPSGVDNRREVLSMLEKTLIDQIQLSENNRLRFTRLGDVGKVRLFEEWARSAKKDLVLIREVARQGLQVPKFHYEARHIPSADLFPDLAEDVLELTILGGVDIPLPSGYEAEHANLYIKYTFPYPAEGHQSGKTKTVAGTRSPDFNELLTLQIGSRKARGLKLMRVLKRLPLKLEVYQKGGFLRSDKLLGTGEIKLDVLEGKAEHEESAPIKEGRKAVGGLLSARVRVREPLGDTKVNVKQEKWLVLDA